MYATEKPVSGLLSDLVHQVTNLVRHEATLARAEISESAREASSALVLFAVALMLGVGAVVVLLMAAVAALQETMGPGWAALIVGGIAAATAVLFALAGKSKLAPRNFVPERAMNAAEDDAALVKEKISETRESRSM